jgi:hypothetical protein
MIERRKEPRIRLSLPVTVSGRDAEGEHFTTNVQATSLSRSGALLRGIEAELRCGDVLTVEYKGHKADFRIVWVLNLGDRRSAKVAVHKPSQAPWPWEGALPAVRAVASDHVR